MTFLEAIAKVEGFYVKGSRPNRNFNPGDLEYRDWQKKFGATGGDPRFAIFPTAENGFAALRHLFGFPIYKGKTVEEAIHTFAPSSENNTSSYIESVCKFVGCKPGDIIDTLVAMS